MIRITDRTLSCLDKLDIDTQCALDFLSILIKTDVDSIEISEKLYQRLAPLPEFSSYVMRVNDTSNHAKYPEINKFVCRNPAEPTPKVCAEILLNDTREVYTISRNANHEKVRIRGLDNCLLGDYPQKFAQLKSAFKAIEFCPTNRFFCAGAIAAEWILCEAGNEIVTSFGGFGGFAPTEELIMILRGQRLRKVGKTYAFFPEMARIFEKLISVKIPDSKPVIGRRIFQVESGIHVDGIVKQPKCYEPFPPEVVGLSRQIILGKHSGAASVRAKMKELGIKYVEEKLPEILQQVKDLSIKKNAAITDGEFIKICEGVQQ